MYHPDAKELKDFYNSQKRIAAYSLKSDKLSGIIGTPKADSEGYDKVINLLEEIETQIPVYLISANYAYDNDFTVDATNNTKILNLLGKTNKTIGKPSFTLKSLPLDDIQKMRDYMDTLGTQSDELNLIRQNIDDRVNLPVADPQHFDEDLIRATDTEILERYRKLEEIINTIKLKIIAYDSGTVQPVKLGGGLHYNLDEPLSKSAMYQTLPTRYM